MTFLFSLVLSQMQTFKVATSSSKRLFSTLMESILLPMPFFSAVSRTMVSCSLALELLSDSISVLRADRHLLKSNSPCFNMAVQSVSPSSEHSFSLPHSLTTRLTDSISVWCVVTQFLQRMKEVFVVCVEEEATLPLPCGE